MTELFRQFKLMFDTMETGAFFQNGDGTLAEVNPAALELLGLNRDQFAERPLFHPAWCTVSESGVPLQPEEFPSLIALRTGRKVSKFIAGVHNPFLREDVWLEITAIPLFSTGEAAPCQVFVTLNDITTRKKTEESLRESEERYRAMVENSFDVIFILDAAGTFRYVCPSWQQHFGYAAAEVIGRPFAPVVHPDDVQPCVEYLTRILTSGHPDTSPPYRVKCSDGSWKTFIANGSRFIDAHGEALFHGIGRNISVLQVTLDLLQTSEERYRAIVNSQTEFVERFLPGGILTFVNDALCRYTGNSADELLGTSFYRFVHPDDLERLVEKLATLTPEQPSVDTIDRIVFPDGRVGWHHWTNTAIFDSNSNITEYQAVGRDITQQKLTEIALEKSELLFRQFFNLPLVGTAITSPTKGWLAVNDRLCNILGYTQDEFVTMTWADVTHPDFLTASEAQFDKVMAGEIDGYTLELLFIRKDGTNIWGSLAAQCVRDQNGNVEYFAALIQDITDRKSSLDQLDYVNECFTQALNGSQHILYRLNMKDGGYDYLSPVSEKIHGIPHAEALHYSLEQVMERIHPDDRLRISGCVDDAVRTRTANSISLELEYRLRRTDDSYCWLHDSTTLIVNDAGEMQHFFGSAYEITGRKQMEIALRESEERFRIIIEKSPISMAVVSMDGTIEYVNSCAIDTFGYPLAEIPHMNDWWRVAYPDPVYRQQVVAQWTGLIETAIAENSHIERREYRTTCKNGTVRTMMIFGVLVANKVFVMFEDISEQKKIERDLRESEERYRRFIATANEGIGITDRAFTITYANSRLAEMLGYEAAEIVGMPVSRLLSTDEQPAIESLMAQRNRGEYRHRECRHQRKDGSYAWLLTSSTPIIDNSGVFQGCFAMFTDLTGRKEAEIALQKAYLEMESRVEDRTAALAAANEQVKLMSFDLIRAQELERARIAAELHDHVGQALLLAKMRLDMLASEIPPEGEQADARAISALVETCIHDIRTLTFGMRPPLLDTAGIEAALEWLCKSIRKDYRVQVDMHCSCRPLQLSGEVRYSLYQAVRELLLNVVKHAGVNRAELTLRDEESTLIVQVVDNGSGFSQFSGRKSLANVGGLGIFNVQQRIEQMGGRFALESNPDRGTSVTLSLPRGE